MAGQNNSLSRSYGFIGLGVMGWGMAKNLRARIPKSSTLYVCEVVAERRDQWVAETPGDIQVATSPREISEKSDIIITMLPRGEHVREVFTNPITGLLSLDSSEKKEDKIFIDCSTIDVEASRYIGEAVQQSGLGVFADAPVSGGVGGANAGTLTFMVGSSPGIFEQVKSVIVSMGKAESIFHCGGAGAGLATKLINNYLSAINMIGVCEGMNMGRLYGLDPAVLAGVINASTGMSRNSREQNPVKGISATASSANDFKGGFTTELCRGVLGMSIELSKQLNAKSVFAPAVQELFNQAVMSEKCKGQDFRSIYRLFVDSDRSDLTK
ncbi:NAD binding domain of 6-phosphogluconate dehydrogenase-domain-containing protein [Dactylonectria macrodidyma]|uniref:3-hydroxyisobutyrate dehydrogenase n=1 Tax=Dactylonectria macrodidyma TaxID=307937 RepID=A0A9P9FHS2_9HYPO|nr:NAD binding domain of 6-phosphogluconate dehydrogenase-domain-containing protein [Dactylonectria macrodidyma]